MTKLTDLRDPINPGDVANKNYVDHTAASGMVWPPSDNKMYGAENGSWQEITIQPSGQTVQYVATQFPDRIRFLVKGDTRTTLRAIYAVNGVLSPQYVTGTSSSSYGEGTVYSIPFSGITPTAQDLFGLTEDMTSSTGNANVSKVVTQVTYVPPVNPSGQRYKIQAYQDAGINGWTIRVEGDQMQTLEGIITSVGATPYIVNGTYNATGNFTHYPFPNAVIGTNTFVGLAEVGYTGDAVNDLIYQLMISTDKDTVSFVTYLDGADRIVVTIGDTANDIKAVAANSLMSGTPTYYGGFYNSSYDTTTYVVPLTAFGTPGSNNFLGLSYDVTQQSNPINQGLVAAQVFDIYTASGSASPYVCMAELHTDDPKGKYIQITVYGVGAENLNAVASNNVAGTFYYEPENRNTPDYANFMIFYDDLYGQLGNWEFQTIIGITTDGPGINFNPLNIIYQSPYGIIDPSYATKNRNFQLYNCNEQLSTHYYERMFFVDGSIGGISSTTELELYGDARGNNFIGTVVSKSTGNVEFEDDQGTRYVLWNEQTQQYIPDTDINLPNGEQLQVEYYDRPGLITGLRVEYTGAEMLSVIGGPYYAPSKIIIAGLTFIDFRDNDNPSNEVSRGTLIDPDGAGWTSLTGSTFAYHGTYISAKNRWDDLMLYSLSPQGELGFKTEGTWDENEHVTIWGVNDLTAMEYVLLDDEYDYTGQGLDMAHVYFSTININLLTASMVAKNDENDQLMIGSLSTKKADYSLTSRNGNKYTLLCGDTDYEPFIISDTIDSNNPQQSALPDHMLELQTITCNTSGFQLPNPGDFYILGTFVDQNTGYNVGHMVIREDGLLEVMYKNVIIGRINMGDSVNLYEPVYIDVSGNTVFSTVTVDLTFLDDDKETHVGVGNTESSLEFSMLSTDPTDPTLDHPSVKVDRNGTIEDENLAYISDVENAILATQIWLPAVDHENPDASHPSDTFLTTPTDIAKNYLCRVRDVNNVFQWIANGNSWTLYSTNTDYVDEQELPSLITTFLTSLPGW